MIRPGDHERAGRREAGARAEHGGEEQSHLAPGRDGAGGAREHSDLARRLGEARRRHRRRPLVARVGIVAAGVLITLAGIVMTGPVPGPGILVIPFGLYLVALEFDRAERALVWALDYGERQRRKAAEATTKQKVLSAIAATVVLAGAFIAALLLFDLPLLPDD